MSDAIQLLEVIVYGGLLLLVAVGWLSEQLAGRYDDESDQSEIERSRSEYVNGDMTLREFEWRAELAVDPGVRQVRSTLKQIDGVDEDISRRVAAEYRSIVDLSEASHTDLEDIHGIGPSRSEAILDRVE